MTSSPYPVSKDRVAGGDNSRDLPYLFEHLAAGLRLVLLRQDPPRAEAVLVAVLLHGVTHNLGVRGTGYWSP